MFLPGQSSITYHVLAAANSLLGFLVSLLLLRPDSHDVDASYFLGLSSVHGIDIKTRNPLDASSQLEVFFRVPIIMLRAGLQSMMWTVLTRKREDSYRPHHPEGEGYSQ